MDNMSRYITKIIMKNFGRFKYTSIEFNQEVNLLIGDNESGKSTILNAIDIVLKANKSKIDNIGLDKIFNKEAIKEFFTEKEKKLENLPNLLVEIYLNDLKEIDLEGKYNSLDINSSGLVMECVPNDEFSKEINQILNNDENNFPFEYYDIIFKTFAGDRYSYRKRFINNLLLDSTQINNEYATRHYINELYLTRTSIEDRNKNKNEYRKHKEEFKKNILSKINDEKEEYSFSIKTDSKSSLERDITIEEDGIEIEKKGKGRQCFIKADFALRKSKNNIDILLLEEPENHLSHINMKKLINRISKSNDRQLFITTHNTLVSTRLNLKNAILLNSNTNNSISLNKVSDETADFFIKASDNNLLQFILSKKVILVEGNAEYMLMEQFFKQLNSEKPEDNDIDIISISGNHFKRYLEIAKILKIKTAVITDNDKDYKKNIEDKYKELKEEYIKIFSEIDDSLYTFEKVFYEKNKDFCNKFLFERKSKNDTLDRMIEHKSEAAYSILLHLMKDHKIEIPDYMKEAIQWIKQ